MPASSPRPGLKRRFAFLVGAAVLVWLGVMLVGGDSGALALLRARDRLRSHIRSQLAATDGTATVLGALKAACGPDGEQLTPDELEISLAHFCLAARPQLVAVLAWLLVVLGEHPDLARRLREEADSVLGDGAPTLAQVDGLAKARAVSREVLRAYPITATTLFGVATQDLEFDGYTIRAGWKGAGAIWPTLQDASTFRDPAGFNDDRLSDEAFAALPANSFVPQGGGPHRCVAETLVQTVMPAFLGWFVGLALGRMPEGLRNLGAYALRYSAQTYGYVFLLTDKQPTLLPGNSAPGMKLQRQEQDDKVGRRAEHHQPGQREQHHREELAALLCGGLNPEHEREDDADGFVVDLAEVVGEEIRRGRHEESLALLTRMISVSPSEADYLYARGEVYRLRAGDQDLDAALADFRAAVAVGGEPPETHRALGMIQRRRDQLSEARASFQRYLEVAPQAPDSPMIRSYVEELGR